MGAAIGTLFAIGSAVLIESLVAVPVVSALVTNFLIDFALTTGATAALGAVGFAGSITATTSAIAGSIAAIQAIQGGVLGVIGFLAANNLLGTGLFALGTVGIAATLFGGGLATGYSLATQEKESTFNKVLFGTQKFISIFDVLLHSTGSGITMRLPSGQKRGRTVYNNGRQSSVAKRVRR